MSVVRRTSAWGLALAAVLLVGCSGSGSDAEGESVSIFDLGPGDCFLPPAEILVELPDLNRVPCSVEHFQEVYAVVPYRAPAGADPSSYPGVAALEAFANGACVEAFAPYVGVSYQDSDLLFTHFFPSARGWEQGGDRNMTCVVFTTGAPLTASVAGSRL